ncbi:unnamed protein product [Dicrocoelium dendriticum]|nr:unnamed protein product [Dicrocoelium dendriticum]
MVSRIVCVPDVLRGSGCLVWKIKRRQAVNPSTLICTIERADAAVLSIYAPAHGWATALLDDGTSVTANCGLFRFEACAHHVVMKDLCAECGANLRRDGGTSGERIEQASANIRMVHSIPELQVSESVAAELALRDERALLASRKLVLLVDLDETVLHTTNDPQAFNHQNVTRYRLPGSPLVYHTSFRPHLHAVLDRLAKYYEMHICTFGNRVYAHQLAGMIDPDRRYFSHRILSRDECFNPVTKSANLKALFPRGLNLVCIIDDRGEVWDWSPHLIQVKPYRYFHDALDVHTFPWPTSPPITTTTTEGFSPEDCTSSVCTTPLSDGVTTESVRPVNASILPTGEEHSAESALHPLVTVTFSEPVQEGGDKHSFEKAETQLAMSSASFEIDNQADSNVAAVSLEKSDEEQSALSADFLPPSCSPEDRTPKISGTPDDDYLLRLQEILITLHRRYYQEYDQWRARHPFESDKFSPADPRSDQLSASPSISSSHSSPATSNCPSSERSHRSALPNVADVIADLRAAVLGPSCHVTLSGLAPVKYHDRSVAGRMVRGLGAVLHNALRLPPASTTVVSMEKVAVESTPHPPEDATGSKEVYSNKQWPLELPPLNIYTTHLVACRRGTQKHIAAVDFVRTAKLDPPSLHIVSPQWLWDCHFYWKHLPESDYPLVHDFHPSEFDPEIDPVPGTLRYARRQRRYYAERSFQPQLTHSSSLGDAAHAHFPRQVQSHSERRHHRVRRHKSDHQSPKWKSAYNPEQSTPRLDIGIVQSAIESIRAERAFAHRHNRHRLSRLSHDAQCDESSQKQKRTVSYEELPAPPTTASTSSANESGGTLLTSVRPLTSMDVGTQGSPAVRSNTSPEASHDLTYPQSNMASLSEVLVEVRDTGDHDTDSSTVNQTADDSEESATECSVENELGVDPFLQSFLPPPKTLILADNPLMHLPPQAASQMLAEVEDAVMEEDTELVSSVPAEAELYDPATLGLEDTDSSPSLDDEFENSTIYGSNEVGDNGIQRSQGQRTVFTHRLGKYTNPMRKRPLCRRRSTRDKTHHIDRKIRHLDSSKLEHRHSQSADGDHGNRAPINLSVLHDSESELDADGPEIDYFCPVIPCRIGALNCRFAHGCGIDTCHVLPSGLCLQLSILILNPYWIGGNLRRRKPVIFGGCLPVPSDVIIRTRRELELHDWLIAFARSHGHIPNFSVTLIAVEVTVCSTRIAKTNSLTTR